MSEVMLVIPRTNPPVGLVFYNDDAPWELCLVTGVDSRWVHISWEDSCEGRLLTMTGEYHVNEWADDEFYLHLHAVHIPTPPEEDGDYCQGCGRTLSPAYQPTPGCRVCDWRSAN